MVQRRKLAACLCLVLYVFSMSLFVVEALADNDYTTNTTFWHWLAGGTNRTIGNFLQSHIGTGNLLGYFPATGVCARSSDNKHHAESVTGVSDDGYCMCVCEACGDEFKSSTLAQDVYEDCVSELPAQGLNSDGSLIWHPTFSDLDKIIFYQRNGNGKTYNIELTSSDAFTLDNSGFISASPRDSNSLSLILSKQSDYYYYYSGTYDINIPVPGTYTSVVDTALIGYTSDSSGDVAFSSKHGETSKTCYSQVMTFTCGNNKELGLSRTTDFYGIFFLPYFRIVPDDPFSDISSSDGMYSKTTRPTAISGAYGTIDGNGNIQRIESSSIVNEDDHTVYNPVTNTTHGITDWTYDYDNRSYDITADDGSNLKVTYGNDNVTIVEDGASYNVYYITESSGGNGGGGADHAHSYSSVVTTQPTCTLPGVKTYTCTCGDSYTENIPAKGHSWAVKTQVFTEYGDDGEVIQQGYTIFRCSACGEEYRNDSGSLPPGGSSASGGSGDDTGTIWGKLGQLFGTIALAPLRLIEAALSVVLDGLISLAQVITDGLTSIVEMILGWFDVIPGLFGGFSSFLGAVFSFLPEEMVMLLEFGLAAVIFAGILRAVLGR